MQEMGEVIIRCQVMDVEAREIRNEKTILIFPVTDFTDSITVKMFLRNEQVPEIKEHVKKGAFLKIKGVTSIDRFDGELTIGPSPELRKSPISAAPEWTPALRSVWSFTVIRK